MHYDYPVIDSHTHLQSIPGHLWDSPPQRALSLMDSAGIQCSICMTYCDASPDNREPLEYIQQCVVQHPSRLIGYARINPMFGKQSEELLEFAITSMNMKGLKLHPMSYMSPPWSRETVHIMKTAARLDVPVLFHCGDEELTLPLQIEQGARQCPEANIILGHMGGYFHVDDAIGVACRNPNVYLETSGMPYPYMILRAIETLGPHRVLFASDGPGCLPEVELYKILCLELPPEVQQMLLSDNILRLLGNGALP